MAAALSSAATVAAIDAEGTGPDGSGAEDLGEVEQHRPLQLRIGAGPRVAVGTEVPELRGVPEPRAFHVVVRDLDDKLGPQRHERQVLAVVPTAAGRLVGIAL